MSLLPLPLSTVLFPSALRSVTLCYHNIDILYYIIVFDVCKNTLYLIFFHFSQSSQSFKSLITFLVLKILICFCSGIGHQQLFREGRKTILRTGKEFWMRSNSISTSQPFPHSQLTHLRYFQDVTQLVSYCMLVIKPYLHASCPT